MSNNLSDFYHLFHVNHGKYGFSHHLSSKTRYFQSEIGNGKKILDLGCRDGILTKILAIDNEITGVDIDRQACELCHDCLGIQTIWHDLNELLPLKSESYDIVVLSDVIEHVFLTEQLVFESFRVLKPGGLFLGSTPNAYYWANRWKMMLGVDLAEYNDPTHVHFFSLESLNRLLDNAFGQTTVIPYGKHVFVRYWPAMFASDFFWKSKKQ